MLAVVLGAASVAGIVLPPSAPRRLPQPTAPAVSEGVFASYRKVASEHYILTAAVQMGAVRGSADVVAQLMHKQSLSIDCIDGGHVAAMVLTGLTVSGIGGAVWLRHLEERLGATDGVGSLLRKCALDYVCWAPVVNSANLLLVSLLTVRSKPWQTQLHMRMSPSKPRAPSSRRPMGSRRHC